jgi:sulfur carrier protein
VGAAEKTRVELVVNGQLVETCAVTLADLVIEQGHGTGRVATALNGDFVAASARATHALRPGDRIEIVTARVGG